MAGPWYVRSTDGSDASDGLSWANAKATLAAAATAASAGDTIYVSQAHAETQASAMTITLPGTTASPSIVLCVNDSAEPPTATATTATVTTTGNSGITLNGSFHVHGITFNCGNSTGTATLTIGSAFSRNYLAHCKFKLLGTGSSSRILINGAWQDLYACDIYLSSTSQFVTYYGAGSTVKWRGGLYLTGSSTPTAISVTNGSFVEWVGVDFSALGSSFNLSSYSSGAGLYRFINARLPTSWTGNVLNNASGSVGQRVEVFNTDGADTNYRSAAEDGYGKQSPETTLVRTGGATDGTTPISWKIVTTSGATIWRVFNSLEIVRWNETTGSAITATVEILRDSATNLTDAEIWLEIMYLGTSGVPLGTWTSDRAADILATPADQADSSATWTTTGMSNPNTQKLSVTFTPQEKGYVHARVVVAKASTTVYVDPVLTLA